MNATEAVLVQNRPIGARPALGAIRFRRAELVAIAYFVYVALALSFTTGVSAFRRLEASAIPAAIVIAIGLQCRFSRGWNRVLRDWAALGLILIAYRQVDWQNCWPALKSWQAVWIRWDHNILTSTGLRAGIESFGGLFPAGLELAYLSLYGIPALCLGALYWNGRRARVDRFLTTLFLGTLCAYALLPHFPSIAPRIAYPGHDLPRYSSVWRSMNIWLLDHCDIANSVFPSGHVAVAFSSAFGVLRAIPDRRRFCAGVFVLAVLVLTATVYGRYHYAADGLASLAIAGAAWAGLEMLDRDA